MNLFMQVPMCHHGLQNGPVVKPTSDIDFFFFGIVSNDIFDEVYEYLGDWEYAKSSFIGHQYSVCYETQKNLHRTKYWNFWKAS